MNPVGLILVIFAFLFWGVILLSVWRFVTNQLIKKKAMESKKLALKILDTEIRAQLRKEGIELPEIHPKWWDKTPNPTLISPQQEEPKQ